MIGDAVLQGAVPANAIICITVAGILAVICADSLTLLVGATAVLPAILYLITITAYAYQARRLPRVESFSLGRWCTPIVSLAFVWLVIEIAILTLPAQFHGASLTALGVVAVGALLAVKFAKKDCIH